MNLVLGELIIFNVMQTLYVVHTCRCRYREIISSIETTFEINVQCSRSMESKITTNSFYPSKKNKTSMCKSLCSMSGTTRKAKTIFYLRFTDINWLNKCLRASSQNRTRSLLKWTGISSVLVLICTYSSVKYICFAMPEYVYKNIHISIYA